MPLFVTIILDGVGIGAQPDAGGYGDAGSHTLGHVCAAERPALPNLARLGLGRIAALEGVPADPRPAGHYGKMEETAAGKDSTTGHWELAGLRLETPFPTYPGGFPPEVVQRFLDATGCAGVLANVPASGTVVIAEHGDEHVRTGRPILYTSADSVFQIAAHTDVVPLETLYAWCRAAREEVCVGAHAVGRVIARPFTGDAGAYTRLSEARRDYALAPPAPVLQQALQAAGVRTVAVGKIGELFAGAGFDESAKTPGNDAGVTATLEAIRAAAGPDAPPTFVWTNLVDFDTLFGHRNDPAGFARALEAFDARLPELVEALPDDARLLLTADHGNDPCFPGTDHTREYVPVLLYEKGGSAGRELGLRRTFADHAATVADYFGVAFESGGRSFLR